MKRHVSITAAETDKSILQERMDILEDDFDYLIAGLEKLDRSGKVASDEGANIADDVSIAVSDAIRKIADVLESNNY